jgi:4-hydroxy-3-methylbut-2-enyl diphosphate reductase
MQVIVSNVSGFCGGIRRTIRLIHDAQRLYGGRVYIDGELVHNKQVMEDILRDGVVMFNEENCSVVSPGDCIVTRTHGIQKNRRAKLQKIFRNIVDGTCPHVANIAGLIKQATDNGRNVVIIGDKRHPEVAMLASFTQNCECFVIHSEQEVMCLPAELDKVLVVAQSTIDRRCFWDLAKKIVALYPDAEVQDTICRASRDRQDAIFDMKNLGAEAIVVVGGNHSNNTSTLTKIAKNIDLPAFQVETSENLPIDEIVKFSVIGVIAGASTSKNTIDEVVTILRSLGMDGSRKASTF